MKFETGIGIVLFLLIVGGAVGWYYVFMPTTEKVAEITVENKWIKNQPNDNDQIYMVSDINGNVYKIKDDWMPGADYFKWNSSDIYSQLKVGQTYTIKTVGWRTQFLSEYPNIVWVA